MKFRLITVLWAFALLASAMATFGAWPGVFWSMLVFLFWGADRKLEFRRPTLLEWLVAVLIIIGFIALLLPGVEVPRETVRRVQCSNNLKLAALALNYYQDVHGSFPVARAMGPDGQPWHSWRYAILPNMEYPVLFDAYDPNQSWDAVGNSKVTAVTIDEFQCPGSPAASATPHTNYFAVIGPNTMCPESRGRRMKEVTDPPEQTILLIEAAEKNIAWAEPKDFTFEEAVEFLSSGKHGNAIHARTAYRPGFFYKPLYEASSGVNVAMVDGSIRFLPVPMSREMAVALLTCNGGEKVEDFDQLTEPQLDLGRIWGCGLFVLLSLAPTYKRFAKQQATE